MLLLLNTQALSRKQFKHMQVSKGKHEWKAAQKGQFSFQFLNDGFYDSC